MPRNFTEGSKDRSRRLATKKNTAFRAGCVSDGWARKQKHLPRKDTEKHGKDRSRDTEKNTAFRAGCVSDGINIRFVKGPFDKLRDRGSFATVSELASGEPAEPVELPVKVRAGPKYFCISLRCKTQRFKWRSCSGASPSQLLCL